MIEPIKLLYTIPMIIQAAEVLGNIKLADEYMNGDLEAYKAINNILKDAEYPDEIN